MRKTCLLCEAPIKGYGEYCAEHYPLWYFFRRTQVWHLHEDQWAKKENRVAVSLDELKEWIQSLPKRDVEWICHHYWEREKGNCCNRIG